MSFNRAALLVLALILLATQYSFASHSGSFDVWNISYYGNPHTFYIDKPEPTCIARGEHCSFESSVCCSGMKCTSKFWPFGERCRDEFQNDNNLRFYDLN